MRHFLASFAVISALSVFGINPCQAAGISDVKAIIKVLMFRIPPADGETGLAVIYDKSNPASVKNANQFIELVNSINTGNIRLTPFSVDKSDAANINATAAYLTDGTATLPVFAVLARNNILSISSRDECIGNGTCVLSITNTKKVRIKMNVAAAEKSNVKFQSVFRMMIQEF